MSLTPQWLDELRARISLSAVIGRTTRLTKAGHEYKACCPFHEEKSPSFTVNDAKGFYHCLAGETRVITDRGRIPIAQLAGKTACVLTRDGKWVDAPFRSYGVQELWRIELGRNYQRKSIYATSGHRWFVRGRKSALTTAELQSGHRLQSAFPASRTDWHLDAEGIRHGIVFGDGTLYKKSYGTVNLHGDKDAELAKYFPNQKPVDRLREGNKSYVRVYGGRAFGHMKSLPDSSAPEAYLLGFLAGYLAADGHVAKDGTVILNSANAEILEWVRDTAQSLGIGTFGRTSQLRTGLSTEATELHRVHFLTSTLSEEFFLLTNARTRFASSTKAFERKRWQVRSVSLSDRRDEVFCAEVPDDHAFALEDNILTGNCFGCGAHGDAIRWMTDQRGLSFMDAVKELAAEAGLEIPAADPRAAKQAEQRDSLHDVMKAAQAWFVEQLQAPEGEKARAYLASRGFDAHTAARFAFGYAPSGRQAMKAALGQFPEAMLIEAGLRILIDDKEPYDRFRGRLMLPIEDARGRVIAFGGRILDAAKTDAPKYLNSPDTPLFDKGRTLYNLHRAGPLSRQTGRLVVVEGYMDVIALSAAGIGDCVAPLGTALTERQIELLWRMVEAPVLCFDGDAAGQRAAMRAITRALPLLRPAHTLRICQLPAGMDPDDLVKRDGQAAMEDLLSDAKSLIETLWQYELAAAPLTGPEEKAGLKARLMAHVETIADADIKSLYRRDLTERFSAFAFPRREFTPREFTPRPPAQRGRFQRPEITPIPSADTAQRLHYATGKGGRDGLTSAVLAGFVRYPEQIARHADALAGITVGSQALDHLRNALLDASDSGQALETAVLTTTLAARGILVPGPDDYAKINFPFLRSGVDQVIAVEALDAAMAVLVEGPALEAAIVAATERFDIDEQTRLRERKQDLDDRLKARLRD